MENASKLTMTFILDNDEEFKYVLADPKEDLTKAQADEAMQSIIDAEIILKDGHKAAAVKEAYITTTSKNVLA